MNDYDDYDLEEMREALREFNRNYFGSVSDADAGFNKNWQSTPMPETDLQWTDRICNEATIIRSEPYWANERLQAARERLQELQDKAYGAGSVRYDKERVQCSTRHDLGDQVCGIIEAEEEVRAAEAEYAASVELLKQVCTAAGFDNFQISAWMMHYGNLQSMEFIAMCLRTTKSRIQYILTGTRFLRDFCFGLDKVQQAQKAQTDAYTN